MKLYLAMIAIIFVVTNSVYAAGPSQPVYSLTNNGEQITADGQVFSKLMIKCNNHDQQRYIHRDQNEQHWCAYGLDDKCSEDRIEAAALACLMSRAEIELLNDSNSAIAGLDQAQNAERQQLENELLLLQEEALQVQQRQLDLRKREAELAKKRDAL